MENVMILRTWVECRRCGYRDGMLLETEITKGEEKHYVNVEAFRHGCKKCGSIELSVISTASNV